MLNAAGLSQPGVKEALDRYRMNAVWVLVVSLSMLVAFIVGAAYVEGRSQDLHRSGIRGPGTVVAADDSRIGGVARVQYVWNGEITEKSIHLETNRSYQVGEQVTLIVDRDDWDHVTIAGETNAPRWATTILIFLLVLGCAGVLLAIATLHRARTQRQLLRQPLQSAAVRSVVVKGRPWLSIEVPGQPCTLVALQATSRARISRARFEEQRVIEFAGDPRVTLVFRFPGGALLFSARAARNEREVDRAARAFDVADAAL